MTLTRILFENIFERELRLLDNPACKMCDAQIRHPLLPWFAGQRFRNADERVVFVGKPHRGMPGRLLPSGFIDPTTLVAKTLWHKHWPYWSYTREIAENLYGDGAFDRIAMTNLVKCTNVESNQGKRTPATDRTTYTMAESCVAKLGVIWKEMTVLEPTAIIFYTFGLYRNVLDTIPIALKDTVEETTPRDHFVQCRGKKLGWWERSCITSWSGNLRILVVGHPERMARKEYVELLTNWVREPRR